MRVRAVGLGREMRLHGTDREAAERCVAKLKWSMSSADADATTAGSTSAGVGVAVRSHLGLASPLQQQQSFDILRPKCRFVGWDRSPGLAFIS